MMSMRSEAPRSRWLVLGRPDALGRHYEAEVSTRQEAERLAAGWSGVIVDRRPRLRWSLGGGDVFESRFVEAGIRREHGERRP